MAITNHHTELVSNQLLRDLAKGDPMWAIGEISAQDQAILCMNQQDICGELLAYRQTFGRLPCKLKTSPMRRLLLALQRVGWGSSSRPVHAPIAGDL